MRLNLRLGNLKLLADLRKVKWRYGVTSKVPDSDLHYLLCDVDDTKEKFFEWFIEKGFNRYPNCGYFTPHGLHFVSLYRSSFGEIAKHLVDCESIDRTWISIGIKRGYWFLRNWRPLPLFFLERMVLMKIEA